MAELSKTADPAGGDPETTLAASAEPAGLPGWVVYFLVYPLAFGLALAMAWAFAYLSALHHLSPAPLIGPAGGLDGPALLVFWLAPLAGLAVFQLIFGLIAEHWRGWRFWAYAPWLTYLPLVAAFRLALGLRLPLLPAMAAGFAVVFLIGLAILRWGRSART